MTQVEVQAALGLLIMVLSCYISYRIGFRQATIAERAHALSLAKAEPRVGCNVYVEPVQIVQPANMYAPHLRLTVEIYNEGELAAQSVNGQWKFMTNNPGEKRVFDIHRDFLGQCEKYSDAHTIEQSNNWRRQGIILEVEVEAFYSSEGQRNKGRCHAKYYYHSESGKMVRKSYE